MPNFVPQYFIWCAAQPAAPGSEVQLVKLEWDGDALSSAALLEDYEEKMSSWQAVASDAHKILTDVAEGGKAWNGSSIRRG